MFTPFIISQVLAFASVVMEVSSWQCKRRGVILFLLVGASVLLSLHFFILKEPFSATVILIVAVRFAVAMKTRNRSIMMLFLMVFVGIFFLFDDLRLTPLLALCGSLLATVGSFYPTDKGLRLWSASGNSLWLIHNILVMTPGGMIGGAFLVTSNIVGYWRYHIKES